MGYIARLPVMASGLSFARFRYCDTVSTNAAARCPIPEPRTETRNRRAWLPFHASEAKPDL